jgi:hypothetical protein
VSAGKKSTARCKTDGFACEKLTSGGKWFQAHAPELFACGIAKSGAYNRTLTPFGFQAEERTIWQAPEVYAAMSPFLQVTNPLS